MKSVKRKLGNCRRKSNTEFRKPGELEDHDVVREGDYALDEKARSINLTDNGSVKMEERLGDMLVENTSLFDYENIEASITSTRPSKPTTYSVVTWTMWSRTTRW